METRIAKKSRFRIDKLEERVAPTASAYANANTFVSGRYVVSGDVHASVRASACGVSVAVAEAVSQSVGVF